MRISDWSSDVCSSDLADAASTISLGSAGVFAIGEGGNADGSENVIGGDALGGSASLIVEGGVNAQFTQITLDASAAAGTATSPSGTTGQSGNARANDVTLTATNGSTVASSGLINLLDRKSTRLNSSH